MAAFRIKLSDGTTTINLYDGTDAQVREAGLNMPPPVPDVLYIGNPEYDGDRLARSRYRNRTISLTTKIYGSSLADLKTNIRSIHRLLNDAKERTLLGYGAQVYLEYQWGDAADQSTFFDVYQGELRLPGDYLSRPLSGSFYILNALLVLECKPFGRFTNQDIAQATLENEDYSTNQNYQDITTAAGHGDVPAKMYWKLALTGATGDKKIWIAKRSGARQTDDLWIQGEDESSTTDIIGGTHTVTFTDETLATASGGKYKGTHLASTAEISAETEIARINFDITTVPKGQFRVLIYCRSTAPGDAAEYADLGWAFGWSYGDKTYTPTLAKGEFYPNVADDTWGILDLGVLNLPPIAESDIAANNTFQLRIYQVAIGTLEGLVDPTGNVANGWTDPAKAYDNDTGTWALIDVPATSWSAYLELTHAAIASLGARFYASGEGGNITQISIDGYYSGGWNNLYEGVFTFNTWTEKLWAEQTVTSYRVKFYNASGGYLEAYLKEFDYISRIYHWDLDFIFLLPIDEGYIIIGDIAAADIIAIDGITDPPNVFILGAAGKIEDYPDYVGKPFTLGRENTRLYVLRDDVKGVTFASDVKYQPQFLVI